MLYNLHRLGNGCQTGLYPATLRSDFRHKSLKYRDSQARSGQPKLL